MQWQPQSIATSATVPTNLQSVMCIPTLPDDNSFINKQEFIGPVGSFTVMRDAATFCGLPTWARD